MSKLKVALISTPLLKVPPSTYGGLEVIVANLGKELAKLGHEVTIFAPNGSNVQGCTMVHTGEPKNPPFIEWLSAEAKMFDSIQDGLGDFDIIHGHNWFGLEYRAKIKNPSLHVLHTHHGGILADWWRAEKFEPSIPPRLVRLNMCAISNWMKSKYEKQGIPTRRVYNGVDLDHFPLQKEKNDRFLWFSRMAFFKAPHKAIEIAKRTGIKLDLAGATCFAEDAKYIEQIKRDCDGEQIRFIGEVSDGEKIRLMQNAKALVVTARWGEPFGLHVLESMACGTGVIAMADGGIAETVKNGGILCQDHYEIAEAVREYEQIRPSTCRKNASIFSAEKMASAYEMLYKEIISGHEW